MYANSCFGDSFPVSRESQGLRKVSMKIFTNRMPSVNRTNSKKAFKAIFESCCVVFSKVK